MSGLYAIDVTTFEDAGRFGRCMRRIPSERRERIARLRLPEDRRRSLGAGWLLAGRCFSGISGWSRPSLAGRNGENPM